MIVRVGVQVKLNKTELLPRISRFISSAYAAVGDIISMSEFEVSPISNMSIQPQTSNNCGLAAISVAKDIINRRLCLSDNNTWENLRTQLRLRYSSNPVITRKYRISHKRTPHETLKELSKIALLSESHSCIKYGTPIVHHVPPLNTNFEVCKSPNCMDRTLSKMEETMYQCRLCRLWVHCRCVTNITDDIISGESYVCMECYEKQILQKNSLCSKTYKETNEAENLEENSLSDIDIASIKEGRPLHDAVIDECIKRFALRAPEGGSVFIAPSYLWQYIYHDNLKPVLDYFEKYKALSYKRVLSICNDTFERPEGSNGILGNHWVLIEFNIELESINVYDSLHTNIEFRKGKNSLQDLIKKMQASIYASGHKVSPDIIILNHISDVPYQNPLSNDCGVSALANARSIINKTSLIPCNNYLEFRFEIFKVLANIKINSKYIAHCTNEDNWVDTQKEILYEYSNIVFITNKSKKYSI